MSHFKTTITSKALDVVVKALDQFCQGKAADCSMIQGTPQTALSGMAVGDSYATIPFSAGGTSFTLECFPGEKELAVCHLNQRPTSIFSSFFGATSGAGLWACGTHGSPLIGTGKTVTVGDAAPDAGACAEVGGTDGGSETSPADVLETAPDAVDDAAADVCEEFCDADLNDATEEVALPDVVTEDVAPEVADTEEVLQDTAADLPEDATLTDTAEDVDLPQDTTADVTSDSDSGICQYFCDAGVPETSDAELPADVTLADATPTTPLISPLCGPIVAPPNSVAVACTNNAINVMLQGAVGCVAECGFVVGKVVQSTLVTGSTKFEPMLFKPPADPMTTITFSLDGPVLVDGSKPAVPGFLGGSFVFAFNKQLYDTVGIIRWDAEDKTPAGQVKGKLQIYYEPYDFFFKLPEFLDITYITLTGQKIGYRYPCDQLPNPKIQCTEVK